MDLSLSAADIAFRDDVRAFLDAQVPPSIQRAYDLTTGLFVDPDIAIHFHRALYRKGWSVPHWPVAYGGTGWSPVQRYIFEIECARAGAPAFNGAGAHFVGPVIMRFGTDEQKRTYLPRPDRDRISPP
jgi:alkylation response protein AidB-like acyl-CoA dehydrogenase